jgi:hypothetical protein
LKLLLLLENDLPFVASFSIMLGAIVGDDFVGNDGQIALES